jgi:hypothetical protein
MNYKQFISFFIIIFFVGSSCNKISKKEANFTSQYNIKCINKHWNISDYFSINRIVCLETNESCFISRIDKMLIKDDLIYILDIEANSVFMFTVEGKYVSKIHCVGKGPHEYLNIESMDIANNSIYLLVWQAKQKIMKFDLKLSFISEEASPVTCGAMKIIENDIYCYASNNCDKKLISNDMYHNFALFDKKKKVVWSDLPFNKSYCGYSTVYGSRGCNFSVSSSTGLLFTKPFSDYIYKVEKGCLRHYIKLNFGYQSIENAEEKIEKFKLEHFYNENGLFKSISNLCISHDFTYFHVFSKSEYRCIVNGDIAYFTTCSGVDPKIGLNMSTQIGSTSDYDGMIVDVSPTHIKYMCKNSPDKVAPEIKEIDKALTQNDNSVLLFLKFKSH